ncbi:DUF2793 domain-containing protein [Aurantimonas endophytica]|uniref:DUF2793 domain-containing protein n=1 Tax=Aurantimonas endophytica TaxID=1522175 RepID=A0A7W6MPJ1_9HYPH|nr:DUF2793 domain-containing protein [Aurantimonas endophytica]MBB4003060.1 hypothetical protein [Aurantimonas endophytica]MCO6403931.1 DUF2793 domain-containing protein [Aurantimonas endophytica]
METTPRLSLPFILPQQAQKHVTHNEALRLLDALVQPSVISRTLATPPAGPAEGAAYIVPANATGAWAGQEGRIALFAFGAWSFIAAADGWMAYVADAAAFVVRRDGAWSEFATNGGASIARFGVNAASDQTNRLAVASAASLFTHEGAGHQLKINKAAAGQTASVLFQDGFSGRAEIGLAGDDDLHVKVSADGGAWTEALTVAGSGLVSLPAGQLRFPPMPNPSSDPNTLDDYAEGSFTPGLSFGGASTGIVYVAQSGSYTKIGRIGFFSLLVQISSKGTATGAAAITGFPFNMNAANPGLVTTPFYGGMAGLTGYLVGTTNGTRVDLRQATAMGTGPISEANFGSNAILRVAGAFQI